MFFVNNVNASVFRAINNVSQMAIQTSMDSGALLFSDVNIIRVLYEADADPDIILPGNINNTPTSLNRDSPTIPAYGWVLLALMVGLITATIAIISRYRRSLQNARQQQDHDDLSYHSVHGEGTSSSDLSSHNSGYLSDDRKNDEK